MDVEMPDPRKRDRKWFFTLNNYTAEDCEKIADYCARYAQYAVVGKEVGEGGTPHLQGCLWLKDAKTHSSIMTKFPRMWLRLMKSDKAAAYCAKDGDCIVNRPPPPVTQGARTDLDRARAMVEEDRALYDIGMACGFAATRHAQLLLNSKPHRKVYIPDKEVIWVWGVTERGKTSWALKHWPDLYEKTRSRWWNGYVGQETILFDDYRANWWEWDETLRIFDKYTFRAEEKGSHVNVTATRFIVTTQNPPEETFRHETLEDIDQMLRRITRVLHVDELDAE